MIHYRYKNAKLLFVGINPHYGSFRRGVPFSNNKMFWYLLSRAGMIAETEGELKDDIKLKRMYLLKFNKSYHLGFVNVIDRPTRDISELKKGEEHQGRKKVSKIIRLYHPKVVCFVGKIAYQKFTGVKEVSFGWHKYIGKTRIYVMHFPLRGRALVRVKELRKVFSVALGTNRA
jgi:double-stranded uracil-DNA glycosylase